MNRDIIKAITEVHRSNGEAALVTLCQTSGSTPRKAGAKMLVYPEGQTLGSIGGGTLEYQAVQKAREILQTKESPVLWKRDLSDAAMACGGSGTIFIEII